MSVTIQILIFKTKITHFTYYLKIIIVMLQKYTKIQTKLTKTVFFSNFKKINPDTKTVFFKFQNIKPDTKPLFFHKQTENANLTPFCLIVTSDPIACPDPDKNLQLKLPCPDKRLQKKVQNN